MNCDGPSTGQNPCRVSGLDSKPISTTGCPPRCASSASTEAALAVSAHRSSGGWSASITPVSSERMSKGFLRSGLIAGSKISPSAANSGPSCGEEEMSRSSGSLVGDGRGKRSPGATYACS